MGGLKALHKSTAFIFCCSVAMNLQVLPFSLEDDLQDPVCYDIKLVLIV